jgi:DNA-binding LacI/PurR family transcriptional regulator
MAKNRQEAAARIRTLMADGVLALGTPLPSERALAKLLGLPQPTVHRAIAGLEREGLIASGKGRDRLVAGPGPGALSRTIVILSGGRKENHPGSGVLSDSLVQAAHERADALGLSTLAFDPQRLDAQSLGMLIAGQPAGVVITDRGLSHLRDRSLLGVLTRARLPMASADASDDGGHCDLALGDHAAGAALLVRWLHDRGRRRMAMAWTAQVQSGWWFERRMSGYRNALRQLGIDPLPPILAPAMASRHDYWRDTASARSWVDEQGRHWVGWLLELVRERPLDAILAGDDATAVAILRALALIGATETAVVGYDANASVSHLAHAGSQPVASVDKRFARIGETLVDLVCERRDGRLSGPPVVRLVAPVLVARP